MNEDRSRRKPPEQAPWPLRASIIVSAAVAATVGAVLVIYVIAISRDIHGRLVAVLPIFFLAASFLSLVVFWTLHAVVAWIKAQGGAGGMGTREHGLVALLTFLIVSLIHYAQAPAVQRLLEEQAAPQAQAGSCPEGQDCLPAPSAQELAAAGAPQRGDFARRARLTAQDFALLVADADPAVRAALAARSDLPEELLERLAGDRAAQVRAAVASSPRLSDEAMNRLAFDPDGAVRLALARNPETPPTALDALAGSPEEAIRERVAAHLRASEPVLRRLLNGSGDRAEQLARERLGGKAP